MAYPIRVAETVTILTLRLTLGDDVVEKMSHSLSNERRMKLWRDHENQAQSILESKCEKALDRNS